MSIERFVAVSCSHAPFEDQDAHDWAAREIKDAKPSVVIHLGDLVEAEAASRFGNEVNHTLEDEYEAANEVLEVLRAASPGARHIFLPGNHDFNLTAQQRIPKSIRSLVDYRHWIAEIREGHWEQPVERYSYDYQRGVFRLGQVVFGHGWAAGQAADKQHTIDLALPFGLGVWGHTHRPRQVEQVMQNQTTPLPYWMSNVGTLREMVETVEWMNRKRKHQWGQALIVGETKVWDDENMIPARREWDAEVRIFRTFNEIGD